MLEELKEKVYLANMELPKRGLVTYTWGNVSGIDREKGLFVIKPSGVEYEKLTPGDMVVMDLQGNKVEGSLNPSSDTKTHADYFYGSIPCARHLTQRELDEDYELNTGLTIVETFRERGLDPKAVPAVLCFSHGPFTWGKDAAQAVYHSVVLEECAKMAMFTKIIKPDAAPAPQRMQDKHYMRKHGPNAYYGQKK